MVELEFIVNDNYLITYILKRASGERYIPYAKNKYIQDIENFQNITFRKSEDLYSLFADNNGLNTIIPKFGIDDFSDLGNKINDYLKEVSKTPEYKTLKSQTEESLVSCKNEWESNYEKSSEIIKSLGIDISGKFKVWFIHPALAAGHYFGNKNLCWSHQTYWPNYNTVYLWHETLHSYFGKTDYEHALIELITDDHMRSVLNNEKYPPFVGHRFLKDAKEKIFPVWEEYLKLEDKDIKKLIEKLKIAYENGNPAN